MLIRVVWSGLEGADLVEAEDTGAEEVFVEGLDAGYFRAEEVVFGLLVVGEGGASKIQALLRGYEGQTALLKCHK